MFEVVCGLLASVCLWLVRSVVELQLVGLWLLMFGNCAANATRSGMLPVVSLEPDCGSFPVLLPAVITIVLEHGLEAISTGLKSRASAAIITVLWLLSFDCGLVNRFLRSVSVRRFCFSEAKLVR